MDEVHSSSSSPRVARPEGIPDGLIPPGSGNPESEGSQYICLKHNLTHLQSAAAAAGIPVPAVLLQTQSAAAVTGNLVPAVLQSQPMEGVTGSLVPPEMYQIQPELEASALLKATQIQPSMQRAIRSTVTTSMKKRRGSRDVRGNPQRSL